MFVCAVYIKIQTHACIYLRNVLLIVLVNDSLRLIASQIRFCPHNIYVCSVYKDTHTAYIYIHIKYIIYKYI